MEPKISPGSQSSDASECSMFKRGDVGKQKGRTAEKVEITGAILVNSRKSSHLNCFSIGFPIT